MKFVISDYVVDPTKHAKLGCQGSNRNVPHSGEIYTSGVYFFHKNGHNFNCMQHISAVFGFGIGFVLLGNSSMTLLYTRDKGALPWQPILGLKLL